MQDFGLTIYVEPVIEPVTLAEVKNFLRITDTDDDVLLTQQIAAARRHAEKETRRQLIEATFKLWLDEFPETIYLPRPPLISVTSPIAYTDVTGAAATFTNYQVTQGREPAIIEPAYGYSWPSTLAQREAVVITYKAGYGTTAASVPAGIRMAIMGLVAHMYENREPVVTGVVATTVPLSVLTYLHSFSAGHFW